jgi:serine/threonine protein kinase
LINCYDYFVHDGHGVLIYELCQGGSLLEDLQTNGPMSEERFVTLASQLINALSFIHGQSFVHRDIKPANILFRDVQCHVVKLADFGLSRGAAPNSLTNDGGTPLFASREMWLGKGHDPFKSDVWALGATFAWALNGRVPWEGTCRDEWWKSIDACRYVLPATVSRPGARKQRQEERRTESANDPRTSVHRRTTFW